MRLALLLATCALVFAACGDESSTTTTSSAAIPVEDGPALASGNGVPPAPTAPTGPLPAGVAADLDLVFADLTLGTDYEAIARLGASEDPRIGWLFADLLRFFPSGPVTDATVSAFEELTDTRVTDGFPWGQVTDWLIAWDTPAPPGYVDWKRRPFEVIEPAWEPFFSDEDAAVDWRYLSWGGVLIDNRPLDAVDELCPRGCIPALDFPGLTDAAGGDWYDDERIVFGVVVNGAARAYPKHIMEIHEMVNDELGGRRLAIPYCTLCGSAQAWFTDGTDNGVFELRTSGLLTRSNKVMFEFGTFSLFDTFLGIGLSGPLQGHQLEQASVVTSTWGAWKAAHPDTTIVSQDGGIGRTYPSDPLQGRDDNGPIFPIGDVDPRLSVQEQVLGVVAPDGTPIAFPVAAALLALDEGEEVTLLAVRVVADGGGLRAETLDGTPLVSHQAFWFAWSQFHPNTGVWLAFG